MMDGQERTKAFARSLRRELSLPEMILWQALRGRRFAGFRFRRQHPLGAFVIDFYCDGAKLAVEIDGVHHTLAEHERRDVERDRWVAAHGVETLRVTAIDVLTDLDGVVRLIAERVERRSIDVQYRHSARFRDQGGRV